MDFIDLPLEILIQIAEYDDEIWFKLSILIRNFGDYSILPHVKAKAMKLFGIVEREILKSKWKCHWYQKGNNMRKHGRHVEYNLFLTKLEYYKNGVLNGKCYEYDDNLLIAEGCYNMGKKHGYFTTYYKSDKPFSVCVKASYVNDKKDGLFQYFDRDGKLIKQCTFHNNVLNGEHRRYLPDGKIFITDFVDGEFQSLRCEMNPR